MRKFGPLLLLGGGAVLALSTSRKKKKKKKEEEVFVDDTLEVDDEEEEEILEVPKPSSKRPSGNPPGPSGSPGYDAQYWDTIGAAGIRSHFKEFGYPVEVMDAPLNDLGPDGSLGGGDDLSNETVRRFQKDYNAVSRSKLFASGMGGLDPDGYVGPHTLNALKFIKDNLGGKTWLDVVRDAANKGFRP